jgi:flagellar hook-basal body complex protein FliE
MVSPLLAARAYQAVQGAGALPAAAAPSATQGPSFGDMVKTAMNDVVSSSRSAERLMTAQTQGKADMVDVVTAVASAQASLSTMMAVRDQVISAYPQIMSMPI